MLTRPVSRPVLYYRPSYPNGYDCSFARSDSPVYDCHPVILHNRLRIMQSESRYDRFIKIISTFAESDADRSYVEHARDRAWETFQYLPPGGPGKRIADIGSMRGLFAPAYVELWHYEDVVLVDAVAPPSGEIIRHAADGRTLRFPAFGCNIELNPLPLPDESFDTVVCMDVLEHLLFDPVFALNEMNRILVKDGRLLLTVPNAASDSCLTFIVNDMQPGFLRHYIVDPLLQPKRDLETVYNMGHYHEYTLTELSSALRATGFEIVTVSGLNYGPQLLDSLRFTILRLLVRTLFPRSKRVRNDEIIVLARKKTFTPIDRLQNRFPSPLYRPLSKSESH